MARDPNYWDGWWMRRASRRSLLRGIGGLSAAGLVAACAPASQPTNPGSAGEPRNPSVPQILKHAIANPPVTLDPNGTALSSGFFYAIYDALTRIDEATATAVAGLAESWKPVNDTTWEFKLRKAKWSDGSDFTAEDVTWTYEYVLNPANKSALVSRIATVDRLMVLDPQTVQIITKGPDPLLPKRAFFIPILPKAQITKVGMAEFAQNPIGTGAFKIKEYKQGTRTILVPNELSWRKPKLQELWLFEIPEATARLSGLRSGEIDAMDSLDYQNAVRLKDDPIIAVLPLNGSSSYNFDLEYFQAPYSDKRVRLALNYAIDKAGMLKNLFGGFGAVMDGQLVPKHVFGYNPALKPFEYDPKQAKDLLTAAGYPNGFETVLEFTPSIAETALMAQAMQQQLLDVGIRAELKRVEVAVWRDHIYNGGRSPIFWNPWGAQAPLDADFILNWYGASSFNGKPYWKNDAFEDAYRKSQQELDSAKRLTYLQQASAAMREDPPVIYTVQGVSFWAASRKVKSFAGTAGGYVWYDDITIG